MRSSCRVNGIGLIALIWAAAGHAQTGCGPTTSPLGANPGEPATFCTPLIAAPATFTQGPNWWIDNFGAGASPNNATIPAGYRLFEDRYGIVRTRAWRYTEAAPPPSVNNAAFGWKADVVVRPPSETEGNFIAGGSFLSPDRTFRFHEGKLTLEFYVAAGIENYQGGAWPEWVVTTAPAPAANPAGQPDNFYAFGAFGGHWTIGCRLHETRNPICALFDDTGRNVQQGGRVWEIQWFTNADPDYNGRVHVEGGGPFTPATDAAWRQCDTAAGMDPDRTITCKDRFKVEITRTALTLFVNDVRYFHADLLVPQTQVPDALVNGNVRVYLANWVHTIFTPIHDPAPEVIRFSWGPYRVNPQLAGVEGALFANGFE